MDNQREGRRGTIEKVPTKPSPEATNVRSLAVVLCSLCELLLTDGEDAESTSVLANARELVRRTQ